MNVFNWLPKPAQAKAKQALGAIRPAEMKGDAQNVLDHFLNAYEPKYPKAVLCLQNDREALMTFYNFPAQCWQRIRTINPIESTFGIIRHGTDRSNGCVSSNGVLHMLFKLDHLSGKNWRRLREVCYLASVVTGTNFSAAVEVIEVDQAVA